MLYLVKYWIKRGMLMTKIIKLCVDDTVELKKKHPCGSSSFKIARVGSEMRIICLGCGRDMNIDRIKLEKAIKKLNSANINANGEEKK